LRLRIRPAGGQAFTETILLTWLMIALFAAVYQMFLVNQTIYRSMTAVEQKIFALAFARNKPDAQYTTDQTSDGELGARVIWRPADIPEVAIPIVGMFSGAFALAGVDPASLRLSSNARTGDDDCPGRPCKRTKMGSGNYKNPWKAALENAAMVVDPEFRKAYLERTGFGQ
jgi:hypothetical protein